MGTPAGGKIKNKRRCLGEQARKAACFSLYLDEFPLKKFQVLKKKYKKRLAEPTLPLKNGFIGD
jgi:hypothetical protein